MQAPESTQPAARSLKKTLIAYIRAMRPKQWTKNMLVMAPLIFAGKGIDVHLVTSAILCFFSFCTVSSSVYIVNDILDRQADMLHPRKCKRPIAAGEIPLPIAWGFAVVLAISGLALGFYVRHTLILVLFGYLALTAAYSFVLKHEAILDVLSIAAGFLLRGVAGACAIHVPCSGWFLLCTGLGALFLALEKRRSELTILQNSSDAHRKALKGYSPRMFDRMEALVLPSLLTAYVFYGFLSVHGQWMMLTVPFVVYGLMRYQQLSCSGDDLTSTPEEVLLKDRRIQIALIFWLATSIGVIYGGIEWFLRVTVHALDSLH